MSDTQKLKLQITAKQLEQLCRHLAVHNPDSEHYLAMLTALQTFIAAGADAGVQAEAIYTSIRTQLLDEQERVRTQLLQQKAQSLLKALQNQNINAIATLYQSLSRSGFWEILQESLACLDEHTHAALARWVNDWVQQTRQRGEQASGYPDAIDFAKADINIAEYTAMCDLQKCIANQA
ncbi:MAG: hypothetical protein WCX90_00960 [Thiohalomonadaceae bacterium]